MPHKLSAGLLLFRRRNSTFEVLIAHMGGPYWARKDEGSWSVPKGEYDAGDEGFVAARREFEEELGSPPPQASYVDLGSVRQPSGKVLRVWAGEADFDATTAVSNTFTMEWPPRSGRLESFPEIDRAEWVELEMARRKLVQGQVAFLDRLVAATASPA